MEHPSKDVIYFLSYPRSGSSWFRYCFKFITNTKINNSELLFHTHWKTDKEYKFENYFDIKNILMLRNYKEAIFSELTNIYLANERLRDWGPIVPVLQYASNSDGQLQYDHPPIHPRLLRYRLGCHSGFFMATSAEGEQIVKTSLTEFMIQLATDCNVKKLFNDFLLDFKEQPSLNLEDHSWQFVFSTSVGAHFHFALQLKRYYDLLEYHDKVSKMNPNNALMIKYEDFMKNPFFELNRVVDFMEETHLVISEHTNMFRNNLDELIENIEYHKNVSISEYRKGGKVGGFAYSYGRDDKYHHSSDCQKEFLMEIDNVLKNKNLELFSKYLSDYEEGD